MTDKTTTFNAMSEPLKVQREDSTDVASPITSDDSPFTDAMAEKYTRDDEACIAESQTTMPGVLSEEERRRIWRERFGDYDEQAFVSLSRNDVRAIAHRLHAERQLNDAGLLAFLEALNQ